LVILIGYFTNAASAFLISSYFVVSCVSSNSGVPPEATPFPPSNFLAFGLLKFVGSSFHTL